MSSRTQLITTKFDEIEIWSDEYDKAYEIIAKDINHMFRKTSDVMDDFIIDNGYSGDITNLDEKVSFIKEQYKKQSIYLPDSRTIKSWFDDNSYVVPSKENILVLSFAFNLSLDDADLLLKKLHIDRGVDVHDIHELPYYFCLLKKLPFDIVLKIKNEIKDIEFENQGKSIFTNEIAEDVLDLESVEQLIDYIKKNTSSFNVNYVRARDNAIILWREISNSCSQIYVDYKSINESDFDKEIERERDNRKSYEKKTVELHTEDIINTILGYGKGIKKVMPRTKSYAPLFKNNPIIHPLFASNFPNVQLLTKALDGNKVEADSIRKILILLEFYLFWSFPQEDNDLDANNTWIIEMNDILSESGLSEMYYGNPFDAIFLFCNKQYEEGENPLDVFRDFMLYTFENSLIDLQ